jgi:hypothetical protein
MAQIAGGFMSGIDTSVNAGIDQVFDTSVTYPKTPAVEAVKGKLQEPVAQRVAHASPDAFFEAVKGMDNPVYVQFTSAEAGKDALRAHGLEKSADFLYSDPNTAVLEDAGLKVGQILALLAEPSVKSLEVTERYRFPEKNSQAHQGNGWAR